MTISWFCVWQAEEGRRVSIDPYDLNGLLALVRGCPGLTAGHVLTPVAAHDPYYADASGSPSLILQLEFDDIAALERCLRRGGYLACLADPCFLPSMAGAVPGHQAMLTRRYPVAETRVASADGSTLSYWVEYAGPAEDENAWLDFYVDHHPPLLAKFPGIRRIEIYTPAVVISGLPIGTRPSMQRNKTVFDSAQAMTEAMRTPVREALRQDFHALPPFQGTALHFPFRTLSFPGSALP